MSRSDFQALHVTQNIVSQIRRPRDLRVRNRELPLGPHSQLDTFKSSRWEMAGQQSLPERLANSLDVRHGCSFVGVRGGLPGGNFSGAHNQLLLGVHALPHGKGKLPRRRDQLQRLSEFENAQ